MKAAFISAYVLQSIVLSFLALVMLYGDPSNARPWLGVLLLSAPILIFFGHSMLHRHAARTSVHLPWISAAGLLGLGWLLITAGPADPARWPLFIAAALSVLGLLAYLYWYSRLAKPAARAPKVGARLPALKFSTLDGQVIDLDPAKDGPLLLVFFRGNWCPFCIAQVKEYAVAWQTLAERGIRILFVSPQPARLSQRLADQLQAPLIFLVDRQLAMAARLGIMQKFATPLGLQFLGHPTDSVLPATILSDQRGMIDYMNIASNYRIRPHPREILNHIDENATP